MKYTLCRMYWALCLGLCILISPAGSADDYNNKVKPILSQHCFTCHGPDSKHREGELRLDVAPYDDDMASDRIKELFGSDHASSLIFERITAQDDDDRMPPSDKPALTEKEIGIIADWLDDGAPYSKHWAFIAPTKPGMPTLKQDDWPRTTLDRLVLATLESNDISPAPLATPETRLRRVYLDLIGILPTIEQVSSFVANPSEEAYTQVVDKLLASEHFGERWGRHWLDNARYADSNGYSIDGSRQIWPYRDWVINALNEDMPFDQFITEQLAGDLLPNATQDQRVATGFHRNTMINQEGGIDKEEFRIESIVDRVNTTGAVFLGLTMECAKCHDHKYDPLYQSEYYKLFAFYNNDDEIDIELPSPNQKARLKRIQKEIDALVPKRNAYKAEAIKEPLTAWVATVTEETLAKWNLKEKDAIATERSTWTDEQERLIQKRFLAADEKYQELENEIRSIEKKKPRLPKTMVLKKRPEARVTQLFEQGDFTRKAEVVTPGTPAVLHPYKGPENGSRLDLAHWLSSPENPLTARVMVNRYWQYLFGRGIVETENDFGYQGSLPTHPEVLDYLAAQFRDTGWSIKKIIREIVLSSTYQQSSHRRPELDVIDPKNYLLARQNRVRLDAEIIRDVSLSASGQLDTTIGGPGVYPPQPDGVMKLGQSSRAWNPDKGSDRHRRGMYTFFWRATPYPSLMVFDAPNAMVTCTRRSRSNTPLQALTLLNDQAFIEQAQALAERISSAPMATDEDKLHYAFMLCLGRAPEASEVLVLSNLLKKSSGDQTSAWFPVARTLLNLDEFITRE